MYAGVGYSGFMFGLGGLELVCGGCRVGLGLV